MSWLSSSPTDYKAILGKYDKDEIDETQRAYLLRRTYVHWFYDDTSDVPRQHDIALMELQSAVSLDDDINAVCLPENNQQATVDTCYQIGWGRGMLLKSFPEYRANDSPFYIMIVKVDCLKTNN